MRKTLILATIIVMLLIILTGCVDVNYEVTLNSDGTADISYIYGFDKERLSQIGTTAEETTSDMKKSAEENNYTIEVYSDDKIEGFKAKKHVENLSEISLENIFGESAVKDSDESQLKIEKGFLNTAYSGNIKIDLTAMQEEVASIVSMKYTINLPVKAGQNNANEVSDNGKTLTWNLEAGKINEISFEANSNILEIITFVIIMIIIVIIVIIMKKSKKRK